MVLAQGGKFGGYALLLLDGRPRFIYNYLGLADTVLESSRCLPVGRVTLTFVFQKTGAPSHSKAYGAPGIGRLFLGEEEVASGPLEKTVPLMLNFSGSLTCGYHHAEPFFGYELPFRFDETIRRVDVGTHSNAVIDDALALELYLKSQ